MLLLLLLLVDYVAANGLVVKGEGGDIVLHVGLAQMLEKHHAGYG